MSTDARERLARAAADCGIALAEGDVDRLAGLVERVEAGVGPDGSAAGSAGEPASPAGAARPLVSEDDRSGWVWRSDEAPPPDPTRPPAPLDGWRLAVKDIIAVAGRPLRCGSAATYDAPAEAADAHVVADLRAAGARLVGTTRLHEFAFGTIGLDRAFGMPANPVDSERVPGGSSAGAAVVVATGEADISLGTDTGGSVRIPAALCGVVGFKPAYGALSTAGVVPLAPSLDHVGFLVASAERLVAPADVLGLLAGDRQERVAGARDTAGRAGPARAGPTRPGPARPGDTADPSGTGAGHPGGSWRPRRLGVAADVVRLCEPAVASAFGRAVDRIASTGLRGGSPEVVEVEWPVGEDVFAATTALMFAEAAHGHRRRLTARHRLYGHDVRNRLLQGLALQATTYLAARDHQRALRSRCWAVLDRVDAVLTPTVPVVAPRVADAADPAVAARLVTFTRLADLTGLPAVSLPLPPVAADRGDGPALPVGLQIEGSTDAAVIATAIRVAEAVGR